MTSSITCIVAYRDSNSLTGTLIILVVIPAGQDWTNEFKLIGPIVVVPTPVDDVLNWDENIFKS